jgi:hypothetical protein
MSVTMSGRCLHRTVWRLTFSLYEPGDINLLVPGISYGSCGPQRPLRRRLPGT